jgi:TetR/AcrR family transcriptional regulator, repressor for lfrA
MPAPLQETATRERTRSAILQAAVRVLTANAAASLGEVAVAAGVARSTLHRYYTDRAALVAGVGDFVRAEFAAAITRARPHEGTGLEAYTRICAELLDGHETFSWWMQANVDQDEPADTEEDQLITQVIGRGQRDGSIDATLDADWLALHIWAALYTAYHYPETGGRTRREAREMCLRTLVKSAAASGPAPGLPNARTNGSTTSDAP